MNAADGGLFGRDEIGRLRPQVLRNAMLARPKQPTSRLRGRYGTAQAIGFEKSTGSLTPKVSPILPILMKVLITDAISRSCPLSQ